MKTTLYSFIFLLAFQEVVSGPTDSLTIPSSRAQRLAKEIANLDSAIKRSDTVSIIEIAGAITTELQNAWLPDQASQYLKLAISYADSSLDRRTRSYLYNRIGMFLFTQDQLFNTEFEKTDSMFYWYHRALREGKPESQQAGWVHRNIVNRLSQEVMHHDVDSSLVAHHFNKSRAIAERSKNYQLLNTLLGSYAAYAIVTKRFDLAHQLVAESERYHKYLTDEEKFRNYFLQIRLKTLANGQHELLELITKTLNLSRNIMASENNQNLQEADRKFMVTRTKELLSSTEAQLSGSRRQLIVAVAVLFIFVILSTYLYQLFQKNKKLRIINAAMVKEQNHRVKNNLQMLASMISVQAEGTRDENIKEKLVSNEKRINSLALLHRRLYDREFLEVNLKQYLEDLTEDLLFSVSAQHVQIHLEVPELKVPVNRMVHIGLIFNELVTNSIKHGFTERKRDPQIRISCQRAGNSYELIYRDNGKGITKDARNSFGSELIKGQIKQLKGSYQISSVAGFEIRMLLNL